jgi:hypothetical protein
MPLKLAAPGNVFLGGGDDLACIENGSGISHIADFAAGAASGDVIDVSAFFSTFHDVQTHSRQHGPACFGDDEVRTGTQMIGELLDR